MLKYVLVFSMFLFVDDWLVTDASAVEIRGPNCQKLYRKWKREVGYKAFALSENGRSCGWSSAFKSERLAAARALKECKTNAGNCYIYRQAHVVGIASRECKKAYKKFRRRNRHRAFAVSASGVFCGSSWGYDTSKAAVDRALKECGKRKVGKCFVYK